MTTTELDDPTAPPVELDEPTPAPVLPLPGAAVDKCPRNPWCVRGAGHPGFCGKQPRGEGRAPRSRRSSGGAAQSPPRRATGAPARRKQTAMRPLLGMAWGLIGRAVEEYAPEPAGPPVGRVMAFQAPYASTVLDRILREHFPPYATLDKATGGMLDELGPLILPPLLVGIMATREAPPPMLLPLLAAQLEPLARAIADESAAMRATMTTATKDDAETAQLVDGFMSMLFSPRPERGPGDDDAGMGYGPWPADAGAGATVPG